MSQKSPARAGTERRIVVRALTHVYRMGLDIAFVLI
jgi:hypothetical protein